MSIISEIHNSKENKILLTGDRLQEFLLACNTLTSCDVEGKTETLYGIRNGTGFDWYSIDPDNCEDKQ